MPRSERMGWVPTMNRWQKRYGGKLYAVSAKQLGTEVTREASRDAANDWWDRKQAELDGAATIAAGAAAVQGITADSLIDAIRRGDAGRRIAELLGSKIDQQQLAFALDDVRLAKFAAADFLAKGGAEPARLLAPAAGAPTLRSVADDWLNIRRAAVTAGNLSAGRWESNRLHLGYFVAHLGAEQPATAITSRALDSYYAWLCGCVADGRFSRPTAAMSMMTARQFAQWGAEADLWALPRNVRSRAHRFRITAPKTVDTFTTDEIRRLRDASTERTWLYCLLGMNCGMYPADIADLRQSEIDWQQGTITRSRSKTRHLNDAPEVRYKLWPETKTLLRKYLNTGPGTEALLSARGGRLLVREIRAGKVHQSDLIKSAFRKVQESAGIRKRFRTFRKTAATLLTNHPTFAQFTEVYLAHAPASEAERHYARAEQCRFAEATDWLWGQLVAHL